LWTGEERLTWCWKLETKTMVTIWPDDVLSCFPFVSYPFCVLWVLSFSLRSCSTSFFLFSLSVFFPFLSQFFHPAFFSSIFSLSLRMCISFAGEVNSAMWINSRGTVHLKQCQLNFTWHCLHEQCLHCSLDRIWSGKKKSIFLIVFYLKN
jgi:hypothetical protein